MFVMPTGRRTSFNTFWRMRAHTTNYRNIFIEIASDSAIAKAEIPPEKGGKKTVANLQFDMINQFPYRYTSDDVVFRVFAQRNGLAESEYEEARTTFFSKGQPCLRTSPLAKRYGWGIHHDQHGKIALYGVDSEKYRQFLIDHNVKKIKAMKYSR